MLESVSSITPLGYISIGLSVLTAVLLFRMFFDDAADFFDCLCLAVQPDIMSIFRGQWVESHWAGTKLAIWIGLSAFSGFVAYSELPKWIPGVFH